MDYKIDELNSRLDKIEGTIIQMGILYDSHYYGNLILDEIEAIRKHLEVSHETSKALSTGDASAKND